jgi:hypothetical protein
MSTIEYWPSLPSIPEHILESPETVINRESPAAYCKDSGPELKAWLQEIFVEPIVAFYFIFGKQFNKQSGVAPHIDRFDRRYGFNYVIRTGGNNVLTTVYDNDFQVTDQKNILVKTWHRLPTNMWHSVHGVDLNDYRIVLTVNYRSDRVNDNPVQWLGDSEYNQAWDYDKFVGLHARIRT